MKICKYCGTEYENEAVECKSCGAKDFKKKCDNCKNIFEDGDFCPKCGIKFGEKPKKCPKCQKEYYSNACPNCGYSELGNNAAKAPAEPKKERKTWLWVLGWIFAFPIPLTILIARNKKINTFLKILIIAVAWIAYIGLLVYSANTQPAEEAKTEKIEINKTEINVDLGKDSETAPITKETEKKETVSSLKIKVAKNTLFAGEELKPAVEIQPSTVKNTELFWKSTNESVVTVDEDGTLKAISDGNSTITVSTKDGVSDTVDIVVDSSKRTMSIKATQKRTNDVNIGDEWSYHYELNGETTFSKKEINVGETLEFYARITEEDDNPDIGEASKSHTVTEEDLKNGFTVSLDVIVVENGGKNKGQEAKFTVTYTFTK